MEYNRQFNISSEVDNRGIFTEFQTETYGYSPQADILTFKLIIDNCLNQEIETKNDGDWIKEMCISKGELFLNQTLCSSEGQYFCVEMKPSTVIEASIASSFERMFNRDGVYLLGQIATRKQRWGIIRIRLGELTGAETKEEKLVRVELQVVEQSTKTVKETFKSEYKKAQPRVHFESREFCTTILDSNTYWLRVLLKWCDGASSKVVFERRIELTQTLDQGEQKYTLTAKPEETKLNNICTLEVKTDKITSPSSLEKITKQVSKIDIGDFRKASDLDLVRVLVSTHKRTHLFETLKEIKESLIFGSADRTFLIRALFQYLRAYKSVEVLRLIFECISVALLKTKDPFLKMPGFSLYQSIKQCFMPENTSQSQTSENTSQS